MRIRVRCRRRGRIGSRLPHGKATERQRLGITGAFGYIYRMIDIEKVSQIAGDAAKANLGSQNVLRVESEPTTDWEGDEALSLLIVIAPGVAESANDNAFLNILAQISDRLLDAGEERFPFVHYATEEELADVDSP